MSDAKPSFPWFPSLSWLAYTTGGYAKQPQFTPFAAPSGNIPWCEVPSTLQIAAQPDRIATVEITPAELGLLAGRYKPLPAVVDALCFKAESHLWFHDINRSPLRLCHFLAQLAMESEYFTDLRESLFYSTATRIVEVFGPPHSASITLEEAEKLTKNQEALAERVYGLGNPKKASEFQHKLAGEGFKYRGRGLIHLTGKANYAAIGKRPEVNLDLVANPELVEDPLIAVQTSVGFWNQNGISKWADADDIAAVTLRVNGSLRTLKERTTLLATAKGIWLNKPLR